MIRAESFKGERVAVMGLARSGRVAAEALMAGGAEVLAWDDAPGRRDAARAGGIPVEELTPDRFAGIKALVLSPGIPHTWPAPNPVAAAAKAAGNPIIGDIALLARAMPAARYVGVTGTNGKSTTTALIGHILTTAGLKAQVGGNLGTAALALAPLGADGFYVLELSSYQLELIGETRFDAAVWLNLTPDHLDRHGGMAGYIAAKRRIFAPRSESLAVVGVDDEPSRAVAEWVSRESAWRLTRISVISAVAGGVFVHDGQLIDDTGRSAITVMDLRGVPRLRGRHNWQNAVAAYAAARGLGLERPDIVAGIAGFPGLPHRQEPVATIDGIRFVNDSKATNAEAAAKALAACGEELYWIAGGVPKAGGIAALRGCFPRIRRAFLIGEAAPSFAATLGREVPHEIAGTLDRAVAAAFAAARAAGGDAVVLLSPACASFDQFRDFEARGDAFRALVTALPGRRA